ncbi:hypothetical protein BpHYR1_026871, partial [Brachionus plicatilis]
MLSELSVKSELKFECELCIENYNNFDRKPFSLVPCGHAICLSCFSSLQKPNCPFCRSKYESKVPNWEIIKRLPKPTIPIIYYQIEIKLNSLCSVTGDFGTAVNLFFSNAKNKTQMAITDNGNESNDALNEKLKILLKTIDTRHQENLHTEENLKKTLESFKKKIDLEEIKYSNENLKKIKNDAEKLITITLENSDFLSQKQNQLEQVFKEYDSKPNEDLVKKMNSLFLEFDKTNSYNQHVASLFSISNTNTLNNQTTSDNVPPDDDLDELSFNTRQKLAVVTVIFSTLVIFILYPIAMIVIGTLYLGECPINFLIPIWLIVAGSSNILADIMAAFLVIYLLFRTFRRRSFAEKLLFIFFIMLPFLVVEVFNIAWFFTGNAWIYPIHSQVQSENSLNTSTYCNQTVFNFSFWTLNIVYILFAVLLFYNISSSSSSINAVGNLGLQVVAH